MLGSKLEIITVAKVRYQGVLSEVDPINKAMTLINVRSFGSEGRRLGTSEIPPSDDEIPEVRFKIEHIKDFKIVEKPNPTLLDPAIISTQVENKPNATSSVKKEEDPQNEDNRVNRQ